MPRRLGKTSEEDYVLHVFTDASQRAYGCCMYLIAAGVSHLLFAKARVAPLKSPTLARMELQAALVESDSVAAVCSQLCIRIKVVNCWADSLTVGHWLQRPAYHWKTFVANRVGSIQATSQQFNMVRRHCPGTWNVADVVSRGGSLATLLGEQWLQGPDWIMDETTWSQSMVTDGGMHGALELRVLQVTHLLSGEPWWERLLSWSRIVCEVARMMSCKPAQYGQLPRVELEEKASYHL